MPNQNIAMCPYYITHSIKNGPWRHEITCENIRDNLGYEIKNTLRFLDKNEINAWMEDFCSSFNYKECEYYKAINRKNEGKCEKDRKNKK